jgi:hypothetical protein
MEQTAELQINLFRDQLPSMEDIRALSHLVHSGEANQMRFAEQVEQNLSSTSAAVSLQVGIGLFILGRYREAIPKLQKGPDNKEKFMYLAFALRRIRKYDEAIQNLQKAKSAGAEALNVSLEKVATYRHAGNLEAAAKEIKSCSNFQNVSAEYHYQLARLREAEGQYDDAVANYKTALELAPTHQRSLFRLRGPSHRVLQAGRRGLADLRQRPAEPGGALRGPRRVREGQRLRRQGPGIASEPSAGGPVPQGRGKLQDDVLRRGAGKKAQPQEPDPRDPDLGF